ncbi:Tetratricopeptide repeat-containing protein [Humidesulfovibrio mexicanus]|uniref:Tetratricopeptide repeat-containing protein n=1 Tax=Humidesulfovibrio mexicanus TaxID=147047 RepID=A0A239D2J5_9BACT|nr:tetratricopeptide repeat protein [Humidesulfovibrio mexicanus]SNS26635.1 Tetratricopeptide repeat-containing protein [Humidesulfovibrio mexicanus]
MMLYAPEMLKGQGRQYATFLFLSLAVVAACLVAYPQVRRAPLLVAASERLLAEGKTAEALTALREAMQLGPVPLTRADAMLDAALKVGDADISGTLALLLMDAGRTVDSGLAGRAAGLLDAKGAPDAALALLEKRRGMGPLNTPEALHLGDLLRRAGRFEAALSTYDDVLRNHPGETAAQADRAETYLWMGRPAEAEHAAREMLAREPGSRAGQLVLARALASAGKTKAAIAAYKKLLGDAL